ncbi:FaeA/PapI family transcriptional regulator [Sphingomonas sp. BE137]|uniref:FaeA/PapI family transcriptional regulator n=1 Tax=Sphingomonas sp. BE137 TaxID=2817844 RepID=UPI001AE27A33|nr:FaeA/PapI family transcriptional regulator [Sphingomonas sp. BE137]
MKANAGDDGVWRVGPGMIARHCGVSSSEARMMLHQLHGAGIVRRIPAGNGPAGYRAETDTQAAPVGR